MLISYRSLIALIIESLMKGCLLPVVGGYAVVVEVVEVVVTGLAFGAD